MDHHQVRNALPPPHTILSCSVLAFLLCTVLFRSASLISISFLSYFSTDFTTGPETQHGHGNLNPDGSGNVFNLSALQMSRSGSDYHISDEEASVGTQRDFLWGVILGYFFGMYVCSVSGCVVLGWYVSGVIWLDSIVLCRIAFH